MTPPLTPALIAEQLAICDAAGTTADPHFVKFNEAAFDHYRAALEMAQAAIYQEPMITTLGYEKEKLAASNKLLQIALEQSWAENAELNARVEELEKKVQVFAGAHADVAALCDRERTENAKLREALEFEKQHFVQGFAEQAQTNKKIFDGLIVKNTKLHEALRFYGDEMNYASFDIDEDQGERARKALGE